ncbi:putative protein YihR [Austwickia sp. TVS 96-490-7B]|uniref:aldose 1-epimerase family protein n=1 Tax=Austwickia sp. TVS 96-490-7B TaxID=2830843 RepID=UPI001C5894D3|nr:aldose 1-epimerase family protein [Austwickia sp. TVS 96-490-7B]MBW3087075.1 putative protein YihR [Austwickia sp. TVS 96-490-7B]
MSSPSGLQVHLQSGGYEAVTVEVGAGLRQLHWSGRPLLLGYGPTHICPDYRGSVLAPWPNRVIDGKYEYDGHTYQLPLTEASRGHALHGLVLWDRWQLSDHTDASATWILHSVPQPWYPWSLSLRCTYALDAEAGLTWCLTARNDSPTSAPYGCSIHPYVVAPTGTTDDWTLTLPADQVHTTLDSRLTPGPVATVDSTPGTDLRRGTSLRGIQLDHAFTRLIPNSASPLPYSATLTDSRGEGVILNWGDNLEWAQVYTCDAPERPWHRSAVAIEPMSCPPDAFNSGLGLLHLVPGEEVSHQVQITAVS